MFRTKRRIRNTEESTNQETNPDLVNALPSGYKAPWLGRHFFEFELTLVLLLGAFTIVMVTIGGGGF